MAIKKYEERGNQAPNIEY
ncbi:SE2200 family small protein [Staphylococcus aureus]|nr:SE2200 family small protein [Staphylococcus aureus]